MKYKEILNELEPYKIGKQMEDIKKEYNLEKVIQLALNENPYGYSPKVENVLKNYKSVNLYPDNNCTELREKLSVFLNVGKENLIFGNGSTEIISMLSKAVLGSSDEIITCTPSFPIYVIEAKIAGAKVVEVDLKDYRFDLDGILDRINENTKIIYIANPNNPTGTIVTHKEQAEFLSKVPKDIFVIIDEAYYEYVTNEEFPDTLSLLKEYENIIILRTFSKAYGLASLRIGYGIADEDIIQNLEKVRSPVNTSTIGAKAAVEALEDREFVETGAIKNKEVLEYVYDELKKRQIEYIESNANFVFINTRQDAIQVGQKLLEKGIIVGPKLGTYMRVTVGNMDEMTEFIRIVDSTKIIKTCY